MSNLSSLCRNNVSILLQHNFLSLNYGKIFYVTYFSEATKNNAPLLVLHGGPGLTHDYLLSLKELAKYQPVIFYDQSGCGKSKVHKNLTINWSLDFYVKELIQIINKLQLKKFHLLGHSWGGALAAGYAIKYSDNLKSFILASPWLGAQQWVDDTLVLAYKISPETYKALIDNEKAETLDDPDYKHAVDLMCKNYFCRIQWPDILQQSMNSWNRDISTTMLGLYETKCVGNLKTTNLIPKLHEISIPTLITCGGNDIARPETMLLAAHEISNSIVEIFKESSHFPHLEEEQRYLETIENFIQCSET